MFIFSVKCRKDDVNKMKYCKHGERLVSEGLVEVHPLSSISVKEPESQWSVCLLHRTW